MLGEKIANELLEKNQLVLMAEGFDHYEILLRALCVRKKGPLQIVLGISPEEFPELDRKKKQLEEQLIIPPIHLSFLSGDISQTERQRQYTQGGIFVFAGKILMTDILASLLPVSLIALVIATNAHRSIFSPADHFVMHYLARHNHLARRSALSDQPSAFSKGITLLDQFLSHMELNSIFLVPRYHEWCERFFNFDGPSDSQPPGETAEINVEELERRKGQERGVETAEVVFSIPPAIGALLEAIKNLMDLCDIEVMRSFALEGRRRGLGKDREVWRRLRLFALRTTSCQFLMHLKWMQKFSHQIFSGFVNFWETTAAATLLHTATDRVFNIRQKITPHIQPQPKSAKKPKFEKTSAVPQVISLLSDDEETETKGREERESAVSPLPSKGEGMSDSDLASEIDEEIYDEDGEEEERRGEGEEGLEIREGEREEEDNQGHRGEGEEKRGEKRSAEEKRGEKRRGEDRREEKVDRIESELQFHPDLSPKFFSLPSLIAQESLCAETVLVLMPLETSADFLRNVVAHGFFLSFYYSFHQFLESCYHQLRLATISSTPPISSLSSLSSHPTPILWNPLERRLLLKAHQIFSRSFFFDDVNSAGESAQRSPETLAKHIKNFLSGLSKYETGEAGPKSADETLESCLMNEDGDTNINVTDELTGQIKQDKESGEKKRENAQSEGMETDEGEDANYKKGEKESGGRKMEKCDREKEFYEKLMDEFLMDEQGEKREIKNFLHQKIREGINMRGSNVDVKIKKLHILPASQFSFATFADVQPDSIILFEPSLALLRTIEWFAVSQTKRLRTKFLLYEDGDDQHLMVENLTREINAWKDLHQKMISLPRDLYETHQKIEREQLANLLMPETISSSGATNRKGESMKSKLARTIASNARTTVITDSREFNSLLPLSLYRAGVRILPSMLTVGDYVLSSQVCIERKSFPDLTQSLVSGRLCSQIVRMQQFYMTSFLMIEFTATGASAASETGERVTLSLLNGPPENFRRILMRNMTVYHFLMILSLQFPKVKILWTPSSKFTANLFIRLKRGRPEPSVEEAVRKGRLETGVDRSATTIVSITTANDSQPRGQREIKKLKQHQILAKNLLRTLPGVTDQNQKILMKNFKTLHQIFTADYETLMNLLPSPNDAFLLHQFITHHVSPYQVIK